MTNVAGGIWAEGCLVVQVWNEEDSLWKDDVRNRADFKARDNAFYVKKLGSGYFSNRKE
jgi:hypothetical protein